ncbi:hypothetical protein [Nostoc sp. ATCC 53789]|uniref:hypothetical protein n=1 Tax=Nostoc sp. ATCC 53789 TaxID=76335 RepID=UPI000DECCD04|nr:hypothetical protein [Nostoc sp. ATCC 53789]QHG19428.1 hypothetical protein GJB62_28030 [Nostoc sp. ATCC 53789]RCJ33401.1 hypothetical protein A6V25_11070 [Nostoc sp. ATCC 53789]
MASRQKAKQFPDFIKIRQWLNSLKTHLIVWFGVSISALKRLLRTISNHQSLLLGLVLLLFLTIGTIAAIAPGTHTFEGNIISQEMSFVYNGQQPKRFIENIRGIKELESEGIQTLTFTGKFQSELPQVNQLKSLTIQLKDRESKWIIAPVNLEGTSKIDLNELRLQPNTKVTELNYDFYRNQLAFSLQRNPKLDLKNNANILKLYLGEQPIKVIVEGYELPDSNLQKQLDNQTPLEFILNPDNQEFNLEYPQNTNIYITLAKPAKFESEQWFRGKIETKNVQFVDVDRNGSDLRDDLDVSTIVEGKIRMVGQEQEIKKNQFLMGENPDIPLNIQLIRHLQIVPKKGIEARFSGKTKQIQIGLDQDFPVSRIQGSWLDGVLPRDAIIALFSFGAATIPNLVSWLFSNTSKSEPKP